MAFNKEHYWTNREMGNRGQGAKYRAFHTTPDYHFHYKTIDLGINKFKKANKGNNKLIAEFKRKAHIEYFNGRK